jgi:hypothetical protein
MWREARWGVIIICVLHFFLSAYINSLLQDEMKMLRPNTPLLPVLFNYWISSWYINDKIEKGKAIPKNIKFFRSHKSAKDILENSKTFDKNVKDDSDVYDDTESCDIYAECGS